MAFNLGSTVENVVPIGLEMYLSSKGWVDAASIGDKAKIWYRPEEENFDLEILQPIHQDLKDYSQRIYEAISTLSEYEKRSFSKIFEDIENFNSDLIKIRVISPDVDKGAIPIDDGVLLFEKAKELLISSTLSTFKKNRFFSGNWPILVRNFIETLRFGQTEKGSYIVNVIAPVGYLEKENVSESEYSIARAVSNNLARSLQATKRAVKKYQVTQDLIVFENAINSGVSANLCDAIIGMSGCSKSRDVEISIQLAVSEKDSQELVKIHRFDSRHVSILGIASEYYKGNFMINDYEVHGLVTRMDHEPTADYGVIRVTSTVNGVDRNITIQLKLNDYWDAVNAHKPRLPVVCRGDLYVNPRSASLVNPYNFKVINNFDFFEK
ncbi:hypothetical protein [Kushneria sp. TE3]|uniref:hypothetical protein n=1 Tax=Kushneria sp. TE3 TaxID=3449832 RepID=UPI003F6874DA